MAKRPNHRKGGSAQERRRARRAAARETAPVVAAATLDPRTALEQARELFAASGATDLPLSERDAAWDAAAADKRVRDWADATDGPNADYAKAFFWKDADAADQFGGYKLGFADVIDGTLTAVWRGVTAVAAVLQGSRGGVDIPESDVAGVKSRVAGYYADAAKKYDDDTIEVPWKPRDDEASLVAPERAALVAVREALQHSVTCNCAHALSEHLSADGPCTHEDGRGTCSCSGYAERQTVDSAQISQELGTLTAEIDGKPMAFARIVLEPTSGDGALGILRVEAADAFDAATDAHRDGVTAAFDQLRVHLENFELVLPEEHQPGERLPAPHASPEAPIDEQPTRASIAELHWTANIAPEGALTDDKRAFAPGSIEWRELPLTLMAMIETTEGGHIGAQIAGRIDLIWRDGNMLKASGVFDPGEYGQMIGRMVGDGTLRGVSVDLAVHDFEVGPIDDYFDGDGNWRPQEAATTDGESEPGLLDLLYAEDSIFVVTKAVVGMVTVCPFQAFADATIELAASLIAGAAAGLWTITQQGGFVVTEHALTASAEPEVVEVEPDPVETLTAAAAGLAPLKPESAWFDYPDLEELTPLTVTDDGRVYGHAAAWDTCHIGIPGVCTTAPTSETNYAYFLLKELECSDGARIPVGTITLDTGHADRSLGRAAATAHYDDTGLAVADVTVGEDDYGIWFSGALRPDVDAEKVREIRGAALSGDWRNVSGNLELVALLAVNVPGFPIPRPRALVSSGDEGPEVLALVAAGIHNGPVRDDLTVVQEAKIQAFADVAAGRYAEIAVRARIAA